MQWAEQHDETTKAILSMVRDFLRKEVRPTVEKYEEEGRPPLEQIKHLGELGVLGLTIPEEHGGMGMGTLISSLVGRELAHEWPSLHLTWSVSASLVATPIILAGTEEQKATYLPKLASGEMIGCFALTEPDAGSDVSSLQTTAKLSRDRKHWILNGVKTFITSASEASVAVVFAHTDRGRHSISAFLVEGEEGLRTEGVTVRPMPKWGMKSTSFCEIEFNNVVLPRNALLGERGHGFKIALKTLDVGRLSIAAQAVGIASRMLDDAIAYVKEREQFGGPLWDNQKVQMDFAGWTSELYAAWALVEQVSRAKDAGIVPPIFPASAKLFATVTAKRIVSEVSEYFGAMGYSKEMPVLQRVLDVFCTPIYEGTSNVQLMVIARQLGR